MENLNEILTKQDGNRKASPNKRLLADPLLAVTDLAHYFEKLEQGSKKSLANIIQFSKRVLFFVNGGKHIYYRQRVLQFFRPKQITKWHPILEKNIANTTNALKKGKTVDLVAEYTAPISADSICLLLGLPLAKREIFQTWTNHIFLITEPLLPLRKIYPINEALGEFYAFIDNQKASCDLSPLPFLSFFLNPSKPNDLVRDDIIWLSIFLYVAGYSTQHTLSNIFYYILSLPPEQRLYILNNRTMHNQFFEYLISKEGAVQYVTRTATTDRNAGIIQYSRGEDIEIPLVGNNPRMSFQTTAPCNHGDDIHIENLAFGHGIHKCLGANIARFIITQSVLDFFKHFPNAQLNNAQPRLRDIKVTKAPLELICTL